MDLWQNLALGFSVALSPINIIFCFLGVAVGTLVGALPGIGPATSLAILLPLTFGMNPATAIIMLAGIYYGSQYGGSITSVLINTPGESSSLMTAIEGYQMALQGRAGVALGLSAIGSFVGGTIAVIILTLIGPTVAEIGLRFGPPEYFTLILLGLSSIALLGGKSLVKALIAAVFGLLLGTVGIDPLMGFERFSFGNVYLSDGIPFIIVAMGLYAISEVLTNLEKPKEEEIFQANLSLKNMFPTKQDLKVSIGPMTRSTGVGFLVGAMPGTGASVAAFLSYALEKRVARKPERFGRGAVEGLVAAETANNAAVGGAMVPLLTLGIPGSGSTAVLLGALMMYGVRPGPLLLDQFPQVAWGVIASMYIGNVILLILNLPLVPFFASVLKVPYKYLYPLILLFVMVGAFSLRNSLFFVGLVVVFGIIGYIMKKLEFPPAPMVIALVLGPLAEKTLMQSLSLSHGSLLIFLTRPISAALLLIILAFALISLAGALKKHREQLTHE